MFESSAFTTLLLATLGTWMAVFLVVGFLSALLEGSRSGGHRASRGDHESRQLTGEPETAPAGR